MAAMRAVGYNHLPPARAHVHERDADYVIELDVREFTHDELTVEALGPVLTVRGDQFEVPGDEGSAFRLHERLEESFRLPDDADPESITVLYLHGSLRIRVQRRQLESRRLPIDCRPVIAIDPDAGGV